MNGIALTRVPMVLLADPKARQAFDLTEESDKVRSRYGQTTFGQGCLLARRLAEARVPYIQVNWSEYVETFSPNCDFGWDTHIFNFELLQDRHCPILDRAYSALIDDLSDRGMLDDTLLIAMGEFGRTPKSVTELHVSITKTVISQSGLAVALSLGE